MLEMLQGRLGIEAPKRLIFPERLELWRLNLARGGSRSSNLVRAKLSISRLF
jgi:hypothetical protein